VPLDNSPVTDDRPTLLQQFVADRDVPCPACNYNLRGLSSSSCPECAQPLVLRVALAEPALISFLAAIVGIALGAGFNGLLVIYFFVSEGFNISRRELREVGLGALLPFLVEAAVLLALIRHRGWFQRRSRAHQTVVIAACWLITAAGFTIFYIVIR
jgi:hypothetical protein